MRIARTYNLSDGMTDTHHSVLKGAKHSFIGTFCSRFFGLGRDVAMAASFGTNSHIAALMVAFRLAHLFRRLLGEGAMQAAFVPIFEELRKEEETKGYRFFQSLYWAVFLLSSGIAIVAMGLLHRAALWPSAANFQEIFKLTEWMMPSLVFICLFGLNNCLLSCERQFLIPSFAPIAFNGAWIIGALALGGLPPEEAVYYLAVVIVIGCICQWLVTLPATMAILRRHLRELEWRDSFCRQSLWRLTKPLGLAVIGVSAAQINGAADALFARYSELDGPAYLWYAIRLQQLPLSLFSIAIAGALMPPLARAAKRGDLNAYHLLFEGLLKKSLAAIIPFTAALFVLAFSAVNLLFGKGEFGFSSITGTVQCLWGYALGLIPMANIVLFSAASQAKGDFKSPALTTLIAVLTNLLLNALFVIVFKWPSFSVAIATSLSAWLQAYLLKRSAFSAPIFSVKARAEVAKMAQVALVASFATLGVQYLFLKPGLISFLSREPLIFPTRLTQQALAFSIEGGCFLLIILLLNYLFNLKDLFIVFHLTKEVK